MEELKKRDPRCNCWFPPDISMREDLNNSERTCWECAWCEGILVVPKVDTQPFHIMKKWYDIYDENIQSLDTHLLPTGEEFMKSILQNSKFW